MIHPSSDDPADSSALIPLSGRLAGRVAILTGAAGALGRVVWQSLEDPVPASCPWTCMATAA